MKSAIFELLYSLLVVGGAGVVSSITTGLEEDEAEYAKLL